MHTDLAAGYYERGQMDVALDELNLAVTLDPNYAQAYNVYGLVYSVLGEDRKAEQNFERALAARAQRLRHPPQLGLVPVPAQARARGAGAVRDRRAQPAVQDAGDCAGQRRPLRHHDRRHARWRTVISAERWWRKPGNALAGYGLALIAYKEARYADARNWMKGVMQTANPQPETLYLGMCIERKLGDRQAELSYVSQLRNRYPDAPETKAINTEGCE